MEKEENVKYGGGGGGVETWLEYVYIPLLSLQIVFLVNLFQWLFYDISLLIGTECKIRIYITNFNLKFNLSLCR